MTNSLFVRARFRLVPGVRRNGKLIIMTLFDVVIPGSIGLLLFIWPKSMFLGARVVLGKQEVQLLRLMGLVLIVMAVVYLVIILAVA